MLVSATGRLRQTMGVVGQRTCTRASDMVERLDGAYIHDDDWDEEKAVLEPWRIAGDSDGG